MSDFNTYRLSKVLHNLCSLAQVLFKNILLELDRNSKSRFLVSHAGVFQDSQQGAYVVSEQVNSVT
jgi:hypothetical protein